MNSDFLAVNGKSGGRRRSSGRRLRGTLVIHLGKMIISGDIPPGGHLEKEADAAKLYGVSRTAYREALQILTSKGLIEKRPRIGTWIAPRHRWNLLDPDILAWSWQSDAAQNYARDMHELRLIVEPEAARLAALRHCAVDLLKLQRSLAVMEQSNQEPAHYRQAWKDFHDAILVSSHNDVLFSMAASFATILPAEQATQLNVAHANRVVTMIRLREPHGAWHAMRDLIENAAIFRETNDD